MIPTLPKDHKNYKEDRRGWEERAYSSLARISRYSGMSWDEILNKPEDECLMIEKCYLMEDLRSTEAGQAYLAECERLNNTELDVKAFREAMKHFHN